MTAIIELLSSVLTAIGIIKKLSGKDKDAKILSYITLIGYMTFIGIVSFYPYQGVAVGLKTMGIWYVLGIMVILICKIWLRSEGDLNLREAMMYRTDEMAIIIRECIAKTDGDEQIDWANVKSRVAPLLHGFKTDKDKLVAITTKDEELAWTHRHIIRAHEQLITGYEGLLAGMEKEDENQILKFQAILLQAQDSVDKWEEYAKKY